VPTIKEQMKKIYQDKATLKRFYDRGIEELNKRERLLMKECTHPTWTYYPDPSGNNDSSYTCNDCGKDLTWKDRHAKPL
jgi:hypothetical protein